MHHKQLVRFITRLNVDHSSRKAGTNNPVNPNKSNVYVFIVDTGIDKTHPELNIRCNNKSEILLLLI